MSSWDKLGNKFRKFWKKKGIKDEINNELTSHIPALEFILYDELHGFGIEEQKAREWAAMGGRAAKRIIDKVF